MHDRVPCHLTRCPPMHPGCQRPKGEVRTDSEACLAGLGAGGIKSRTVSDDWMAG